MQPMVPLNYIPHLTLREVGHFLEKEMNKLSVKQKVEAIHGDKAGVNMRKEPTNSNKWAELKLLEEEIETIDGNDDEDAESKKEAKERLKQRLAYLMEELGSHLYSSLSYDEANQIVVKIFSGLPSFDLRALRSSLNPETVSLLLL